MLDQFHDYDGNPTISFGAAYCTQLDPWIAAGRGLDLGGVIHRFQELLITLGQCAPAGHRTNRKTMPITAQKQEMKNGLSTRGALVSERFLPPSFLAAFFAASMPQPNAKNSASPMLTIPKSVVTNVWIIASPSFWP